MKYYIIAGEPSGDLHGANLMKELLLLDPQADFRFWGGDLMQAVGGTRYRHYSETAFMGVFEIVANYGKIKKNFRDCKSDMLSFRPDVVILIDYPGFNLRMAKFAHKNSIKTLYYIAPKIWAWNTSRVHRIRKYINEVYTILPFETKFYGKYNVAVNYIGNPIMDSIANSEDKSDTREKFLHRNQLPNKPIIGILAGSREQELRRLLPDMVKMENAFPDYQFIIAGAPSFKAADYAPFIKDSGVRVLFNETHPILRYSHAAMVSSGTATLEAGLLNCPQVVCYKVSGGTISDFFAKKVIIKVPYISLVNLIMEKECVKELFQNDFNAEALKKELSLIVNDDKRRKDMLNNYSELRKRTGEPGSSKRAAELMISKLTQGQ